MGRGLMKTKRFLSALLIIWGRLFFDRRIPILLYHSVDDTGSVISISPEDFKAHLRYLWREGYETVSLNDYLGYLLTDQRGLRRLFATRYAFLLDSRGVGQFGRVVTAPGHAFFLQ